MKERRVSRRRNTAVAPVCVCSLVCVSLACVCLTPVLSPCPGQQVIVGCVVCCFLLFKCYRHAEHYKLVLWSLKSAYM